MTPADVSLERRVSAFILIATPILFLVFLAIAPSVNPTFDDAKYVAVGRNFITGNGPTTVFGVVFLKHSPLWPMIIAFPEQLFGIHPVMTGHVINALSGASTIVLVGYLGWRVRPAIGAIAAVLFASLPYVFDIAQTAGIDLPSIALTLAYIIVGFSTVRTGSVWRAIVLGAIFAVAFLIKETILPFAVVPFILGIMWRVPWPRIARTAGVTLGVAAVGMSWWFIMYAGYTHHVYRADFPEWTLIPSAIAVAVIFVVGLAAEPLARTIHARGWDASATARIPERLRSRTALGWGATLIWFVLLTIFFGRTPKLLGASLFDPRQIAYMVVHSLGSVRIALAFGLGTLLLVSELLRDRRRVAQASTDVLVAMLCGIPLVLLVVGVGETPRHYLAELALLILTGTIGWYHGLLRLREHDRTTIVLFAVLVGLAVTILALSSLQRVTPGLIVGGIVGVVGLAVAFGFGLAWLRRHGRMGAVGILVAVLVFATGLGAVGVRAVRIPREASANETRATADTVAWVKANIPAGGTVAVGSYLSMETSIDLPAGIRAVQVRHYLAIGDPAAPIGLRSATGTAQDFVAVDDAPIKANQFNVFAASQMTKLLRDSKAVYYIYPITEAKSSKMVLNILKPENGFTEVGPPRTYVGPTDTINVHTYKVDLDKLRIPDDQVFIAPDALERLIELLDADPAKGRIAAGNLLDRIVPPVDGSEDALLARLKALAGR
ncbi:MAG TPA: glycosyltransferase family 39 protein [Patescibacteria group bacterium]|nr:glycosyltransferase family 39 protein [Patescibacteria group bacterium]